MDLIFHWIPVFFISLLITLNSFSNLFTAGLPPTANGSDHPHRSQNYLNQINVHKHHTPQHTVPVQSTYLSSPLTSRNGGQAPSTTANIYHFSHQVLSNYYSCNIYTLFYLDSIIFRRRTISTLSSTSRCYCDNLSLIISFRFIKLAIVSKLTISEQAKTLFVCFSFLLFRIKINEDISVYMRACIRRSILLSYFQFRIISFVYFHSTTLICFLFLSIVSLWFLICFYFIVFGLFFFLDISHKPKNKTKQRLQTKYPCR